MMMRWLNDFLGACMITITVSDPHSQLDSNGGGTFVRFNPTGEDLGAQILMHVA